MHFRHRPHALPAWYPPDSPRINQYGFFDDEFAREKPDGEFRAVAIGDSVVMGHGVMMHEAFPNALEAMLRHTDAGFRSYQIINTGVQGYWTEQYPEVLRRTLVFGPDLVLLGFCMNDVITFYGLDPAHGGSGLDYHGIQQVANPWLSYLVNETGFGRLAIVLRQRRAEVEWTKRRETYSVKRLAAHSRDDPEVVEAWHNALRDLDTFYDLAAQHRLPVVLLVFPYDFQVGHPELQEPQRIVARQAGGRGVPVLDVTPLFEQAVAQGSAVGELFLDDVHFSARGHLLVARALLEFLEAHDLVRAAAAAQQEQVPHRN